MSETESDYREHVRANIRQALETLAHLSVGDFSYRMDTAGLPKDEFGDLLGALDLLVADLAESREELDAQCAHNALRTELWQLATSVHETAETFIQRLLDTLGPRTDVARASYYGRSTPGEDPVCLCQWTCTGASSWIGLRVPPQIWSAFLGKRTVEGDRFTAPSSESTLYAKMKELGVASFIAANCGPAEEPYGVVMLSMASPQRAWNEVDRSFIFEIARIITTKVAQIRAEQALREHTVKLEAEVAKRTSELQVANRELHDDIAKRTKTEAALRASEELYRGLVETTPDAILVCDAAGGIVMANGPSVHMFALPSRAAPCGTSVLDLVSAGDRDRARTRWSYLTSTRTVEADEVRFQRLDKTDFLGEFRVTGLGPPPDGRKGFLVTIRDITEKRRQEEEMLRASRIESLGTLAGGVAHDFNNILTGIMASIAMAELTLADPDQARTALRAAHEAGLRAGMLTRQLLTFSRGGVPIRELSDIAELVRNALRLCLSGAAADNRLTIGRAIPPVKVDRSQIDQVLNNLIINARQAMPGGGTITVEIANARVRAGSALPLKPGRYVRVSVRDTGVGIPPENLRRIFDPYFTTKSDGTGLGLTTAYSIVKRHQGHLVCRSLPAEGAEFAFYLPAATGTPVRPPAPRASRLVEGKGRLLVMDDDPVVRHVTERLLTHAGYSVDCVENGQQALDTYRRSAGNGARFDAVILDLTVRGGKGGKDAARELLALDPAARIIVISGYSSDPVLANYREHGFKGMVTKPFQIGELTSVVSAVIANAAPTA